MKILYDCFSCSPYYGSDEGIGWNWPFYMRKYHEVWALVRKDRRADIEKYCAENRIDDIHFIYADLPDWMNFYYRRLAKGKNGILDFLFYQWLWQTPAYKMAKKIHKQVHFDLVHHCGTNDFRFIGQMHKLGIPLVIGPIGGAQETPAGLRIYTKRYEKSEKLRSLLNKFFTGRIRYKRALNKADRIFFSNPETQEYLQKYIKDKSKCGIMTEIACTQMPLIRKKNCGAKTVFLWAGRMEYRKGLEFLFDVLDKLPKDNSWQVLLCGDGRERKRYEEICRRKGLEEYVQFEGKRSHEEMEEYYQKSDVFVFPSLRETTGTVIIEAMSYGLPVICIRQGGGALVVSEECGYPINGQTQEEFVQNFATAMAECIHKPKYVAEKGFCCQERIQKRYLWKNIIEYSLSVYQEIVG